MNRDLYVGAQRAIAAHRKDIRDADSMARRPRLCEIKGISKAVKQNRDLCAVSLNDILEAHSATRMLDDPAFRERLRDMSARLNAEFNHFE